MQPIKFVKINDNLYDYDTMTLVNIISHRKELIYFFIVEDKIESKGIKTITKDLLEVSDYDYNEDIFPNYKIV